MPELAILPLGALSANDLRPLLDESVSQGFGFVQTLLDEYESGANRFDTPGAVLLGAYQSGTLVGVGGVQRDPYLNRPDVGRVRHVYVLDAYRRQGVGKCLLDTLIQRAGEHFTLLTLRTPTPSAAAFYEALSFTRETIIPEATHSLKLKPSQQQADNS